MSKRERIFALIATLALFLLIGGTLARTNLDNLQPNPAYASIYAAMITAPAIAFSAFIAYRALMLNHRTQLAPHRAELYKRQLDAFGVLCEAVAKLSIQAGPALELHLLRPQEREDAAAEIRNSHKELGELFFRHHLVLTHEVGRHFAPLTDAALRLCKLLATPNPNEESIRETEKEMSERGFQMVEACNDVIGAGHLTESWRQLLKSHR